MVRVPATRKSIMPLLQDYARELNRVHGLLPVAVAGKMPLGGTGWNTLSLADRMVMFDSAMCTGCGIQFGTVFHPTLGPVEARCVDIDENDAQKQTQFVLQFLYFLGDDAKRVVFRWGRRPAFIVFTQPGKITRERYGEIQLLGAGKQAVWWGTHPETASDYRHPDGDFLDPRFVPPFIDAVKLDQMLMASCAAAGIVVEGPGTDYSRLQEAPEAQFNALTPADLTRYREEFKAAINAVLPMPEGSGRGTALYGIGNRFGWLARHDPELDKLVTEAIAMLPGHEGAGDVRDLKRGLDDSKGLAQQGTAQRNDMYRQFVKDWRTGLPRQAVVDELRAGKKAEKRPNTLAHLLQRPVEPLTTMVDGLVPSKGLFLVAADPKAGKSYLMTDALVSISEGATFVGRMCVQSSAMYIALEETHSEFMDRLHKIRPHGNFTGIGNKFRAVFFDEGVPRLEADFKGGLLEYMDDMIAEDPELRVFCLDTLQHALGDIESGQSGKNSYKIEYEAIGWLQKYALSRNVCIVLLHHTNKSKSDSAGHRISGSTGIPAAVSGYIELQVSDNNPYAMTVHGRVRGVGIFKQEWVRDEGVSVWSPAEGTMSTLRGVKEQVFSIMVAASCELTPQDLVTRMKIDERVAAARLGDLRKEGRLQQPRRGLYCVQNAKPRFEGIVIAIVKSGILKPATNELKMLHDPEGKQSRWGDIDAGYLAFEHEVVEAIEAGGFHKGKDALHHLDIRKLTHTKGGVVWFFGPSWDINQSQQALPWAAPSTFKTPWG